MIGVDRPECHIGSGGHAICAFHSTGFYATLTFRLAVFTPLLYPFA